jgi:hypothetical protein
MQDLREYGPDVVPKRIGSGGRNQAKWVMTRDPLTLGQKIIMVTQLLNNIKKKSHQFISSLLYEKKLHERKEKQLKALGLARGRTHR